MKIKNIISLLLTLLVISCSNEDEALMSDNTPQSIIETLYEEHKEITLAHNEMLDNFYKQALSRELKFSKPLSTEEMDQFVVLFVDMINQPATTRNTTWNEVIDVNQVIEINQMNDAISSVGALHTRGDNWENVAYLDMFCEEFYNIDSEK